MLCYNVAAVECLENVGEGEKNCKFLNYPYHSHTKVHINNFHTLCWGFGGLFS